MRLCRLHIFTALTILLADRLQFGVSASGLVHRREGLESRKDGGERSEETKRDEGEGKSGRKGRAVADVALSNHINYHHVTWPAV
jgi:hypothetical protein